MKIQRAGRGEGIHGRWGRRPRGPLSRSVAAWLAFAVVCWSLLVVGCGGWSEGGATINTESVHTAVGSPFPTALLIPDREGYRDAAFVQTASQPIGVYRFDLNALVPPLPFVFHDLGKTIDGIPDGLVIEAARDLAFVSTSGAAEGIWAFDPSDAFRFLTSFTYTGATYLLPSPGVDSEGNRVETVKPTFTSGAAWMGGKVYIPTSNYTKTGSNPVCGPGTVRVVGFDDMVDPPYFYSLPPPDLIMTTGFNPTEVTPFGDRILLVTNTGVLAIREANGVPLTPGSVDVVDTELDCVVASYPLGMGAPAFTPIAIAEQHLPGGETVFRGYLGSAAYNHVYELDLNGLDAYLGSCPAPGKIPQLVDKVLAGTQIEAPIVATDAPAFDEDFVVQVAVNHDGTRAYATAFNSGILAVFELSTERNPDGSLVPSPKRPLSLLQVTDPMPTQNEAGPGPVAVRPGVPGVDYQGPDVFLLTGTPVGELRGYVTY